MSINCGFLNERCRKVCKKAAEAVPLHRNFRDNNYKKFKIMLTFGLVAMAVVKAVVMVLEFKEIHPSLR